jgi:acyl-CoA synthetase (AMP-forming)/AMP-acid ligase II
VFSDPNLDLGTLSVSVGRPIRDDVRVSDMFKSGGYNVYPREVEIALEEHAAVTTAAVVGVPDALYGEVGYTYINLLAGDTIDVEQLKLWCKNKLSNYKVPKAIEVLEAMPLLPNGKLDKTSLKKIANASYSMAG